MRGTGDSQLLLGFYGDDFSGSTDVMEVLALAGVRTLLLLRPPDADLLERRPDLQAVGIAGVSRSLPAAAMEAELEPAFAALASLPLRLAHYKVCSTFDSAPEVGSIGRAIALGRTAFDAPCVPVLAGAPALGRYCVFGNLFARSGAGSPVYRLDRHPTMSRHPVTPMGESDLALHLAEQTTRKIALLNILDVRGRAGPVENRLKQLHREGAEAVLLDVLDDYDLPQLGRLLWEHGGRFVVGSSGVEYALTAHWQRIGLLPAPPSPPSFAAVERALIVSGSCSPVTASQVHHAVSHGFAEVGLRPVEWIDAERRVGPVIRRVLELLGTGRSVVVHTAMGPEDRRIEETRALLTLDGRERQRDRSLGRMLAAVVRAAVERAGVRRVAVAGGDTSGYVTRELDMDALSFVAPIAPGSPLCRVHAGSMRELDGLEITFKGGQVGQADFFERVLRGSAPGSNGS
ncbi:MAG TPA: four-carbon acid sugar kinase family protein [Gemmataceae bacterium]